MAIKIDKVWLLVLVPTVAVLLTVILIVKIVQDKENERVVYEMLQEEARQENIDACIKLAYDNYSKEWDNACLLIDRPIDCALPAWRADQLDALFEKDQDRCLERFSN